MSASPPIPAIQAMGGRATQLNGAELLVYSWVATTTVEATRKYFQGEIA
jgi:hypothetical protein